MTRKYRSKQRKKKKQRTATTENDGGEENHETVVVWNAQDCKILVQYLKEYRDGALHYLYQQQKPWPSSIYSSSKKPVRVGSIDFPILTRDVLQNHPYLVLPRCLTSKQRKVVHECCTELDIYHCSVGPTRDNRLLAISIYADAFDDCNNDLLLQDTFISTGASATATTTTYRPSVHAYRPWYYRQHMNITSDAVAISSAAATMDRSDNKDVAPIRSNVRSTAAAAAAADATSDEKEQHEQEHVQEQQQASFLLAQVQDRAHQHMDELLDQPGTCLRDDVDVVDLEALEGQDLSTIHPPQPLQNDDNNNNIGWTLVDSAAAMKACVAELEQAKPKEIAFDLECYNKSKYAQLTCLLQITSDVGKEYVIDTLAEGVWDHVSGLARLFADPSIVKVGHSIGGLDVRSLYRDFGILIVNAFDTYEASRVLNLPVHGLAVVCQHYGLRGDCLMQYKILKELYQVCDWRVRPLTTEMIQYGRYDVHYLLPLRRLMMRDLTRCELKANATPEQDAEARLVAKALAETLRRMEELEEEGLGVADEEELEEGLVVADEDDDELLVFEDSFDDAHAFKTEQTEIPDNNDNDDSDNNYNDSFKTNLLADDDPTVEKSDQDNENIKNNYSDSFKTTLEQIERSGDAAAAEEQYYTPFGSNRSLASSRDASFAADNDEDVNRDDVLLQDNDEADQNDDEPEIPPIPADAATLRLQPRLMRVITLSQERCRSLWTGHPEPHLKNGLFQTMIQRARKKEVEWTSVNTHLYNDLVQWRDGIAYEQLECLPGFVAPLEFLVYVAWKRPRSVATLRRISFRLPDVLEENEEYQRQMLSIVTKSLRMQETDDSTTKSGADDDDDEVVYLYSERKTTKMNRYELAWKLGLAATVCVGAALIVMAARRRKR